MTVRSFGRSGQRGESVEPGESASARGSHLSSRTGLITLYAVFVAVLAGLLVFVSDHRLPAAVVAAVVAFAGAFKFFDTIIGD